MYKTGGFINIELIEPLLLDSYKQYKIYLKSILTILPKALQLKFNEIKEIHKSLKEILENSNSNINKNITELVDKQVYQLVDKLEKYTDTDKSLTDKSLTEKSLTKKLLTKKSLAKKSLAEKSLTEKSLTDKSLTEKSLTDKSLTDITDKSLTDKSLTDKSLTDKLFFNPSIQLRNNIDQEYIKIKLMININCFYKNEKCASLSEFNDLINIFINKTFGIEKTLKSPSYIIIQKYNDVYVEIESHNIKNPNVEILVLEDNLSLTKSDSIKLDTIKFNNINNNGKYVVYNFDKSPDFINAKQIGNKFINVINNIRQINMVTELTVYDEMNDFIEEICVLLSILYRYDKNTHSYLYDTIQYVDNFFIYLMFINKLDYIFNIYWYGNLDIDKMNEDIEKSKEEIIYSYNYYLYCILRKNYIPDNNETKKTFVDEINKLLNYTQDDIFTLFKKELNEFIDIVLAVERKFKGLPILILFNFIFNYFTQSHTKAKFKISKYKVLTAGMGIEPNYYSDDELITILTMNSNEKVISNIYMNNIKLNYKLYSKLGKAEDIIYKTIKYHDCGEWTFFNLFNYLLLTDDNTFNLEKLPPDSEIYNFYKKYTKFENLSKRFNINNEDYDEKNIRKEFYKNLTDHKDILYVEGICEIKPSVDTIIKLFNIILNKKFEKFDDIVQYFNKKITNIKKISYGKEEEKDKIKYYFTIDDKIIVELAEGHAGIFYNNTSTDTNNNEPINIMEKYDIVSLESLYTLYSSNLNIVLLYDDDFYKPILLNVIEPIFKIDINAIIKYMTKKIINLYFINMFRIMECDDDGREIKLNANIKLLLNTVINNDIIITENVLYYALTKVPYIDILKTLIDMCIINENWNLKNMPLLTYAISEKKSIEIIKLLINKFNTVNIVDPDSNRTALMYTVIPNDYNTVYDSKNTIELINLLIDNKADINLADVNKKTVLMHALQNNALPEIIKLLIEKNADINLANAKNASVLMYALKYNELKYDERHEIIELLIELLIDNTNTNIFNMVDKNGMNVLMYAIFYQSPLNIIKKIIKKIDNINMVDIKGDSALMLAIRNVLTVNMDLDIIKLLIDNGANTNLVNNMDISILMQAIMANEILEKTGMIELLIKNVDNINIVDKNGDNVLMYAFKYKASPEIIKILINKVDNININMVNISGDSVLMFAIIYINVIKDLDIIELLIKKGANINLVNNMGINILMKAVMLVKLDIIKLLIKNRTNINLVDKNNDNVSMYAIKYDLPIYIIELLIENGININLVNNMGINILMQAFIFAKTDRIDKIKLLINNGTNINLVDYYDMSILMYAIKYTVPTDIIELLIDKGANINFVDKMGMSVLIKALLNEYKVSNDIIKLLINKGANINLVDKFGDSVLMYAIKKKVSIDIIELLIKNVDNINFVDNVDRSALMYALSTEYKLLKDIIELLINNGANINLVDRIGQSALMYAIKNKVSIDIIELLINNEANINLVDEYGDNVLMYAIKNKASSAIIKLLINNGANINLVNKNGVSILNQALMTVKDKDIIKLLITNVDTSYIMNALELANAYTVSDDIIQLLSKKKEAIKSDPLKLKYLKYKNKYIKLKNMIV